MPYVLIHSDGRVFQCTNSDKPEFWGTAEAAVDYVFRNQGEHGNGLLSPQWQVADWDAVKHSHPTKPAE